MIRIGILREEKIPQDLRVPFTPEQCAVLENKYDIKFIIQASEIRCFSDTEYASLGIEIKEDLSNCQYIFGVKEAQKEHLINGKNYFFFSHTIKQQAYNKSLMQALIHKKIRMIDYECLRDDNGKRIIGFGKWAGIVGAHNGLFAYGEKTSSYQMQRAHNCKDYAELINLHRNINFGKIKIVFTGEGNVAKGIREYLTAIHIEEVDEYNFEKEHSKAVFLHLPLQKLYARKDDSSFDRKDFFTHPQDYCCLFKSYTAQADILLNGVYWNKNIPRLFESKDISSINFKIAVIADISCDIEGSVPITLQVSTIENPIYGIDKKSLQITQAFKSKDESIDIMAIDNLPSELPRDASAFFGNLIIEKLIPEIILEERSRVLERATICENGALKNDFNYLYDYAFGTL